VSRLSGRLDDTLRLIALELEELRLGGEAVLTRLTDEARPPVTDGTM
jgi:hypothetical protein